MKDLTPKQQEIIQSLKEQFAQINSFKPTVSSNPLLNYENEFYQIKQSELEERATIQASNDAIVKVRDQRMLDDFYYLDELLDEISDDITLERKEKCLSLSKGNRIMRIYYYIECNRRRPFRYVDSIEVLENSIQLDYEGIRFENLSDAIASDKFKLDFQSMLKFNPQR